MFSQLCLSPLAFACLSAVAMASRAFFAAIALVLGCLAVANAQCIECSVSGEASRSQQQAYTIPAEGLSLAATTVSFKLVDAPSI